MPDNERRVYSYDPNSKGGFSEVDDAPILQKELVKEELPKVERTPDTVKTEVVDVKKEVPLEKTEIKDELKIPEPPVLKKEEDKLENKGNQTDDGLVETDIDDDIEVPVTDNFFIAAANAMKERGELPEDFTLDESVDDETAAEAIYNAFYETQKKDVYSELFQEFQLEMQKNGYTQEHLEYSKLLASGVNPAEIAKVVDYKLLAEKDVSSLKEDEKQSYVKTMLEDQGFKPNYIKKVLEASEIDDDLDTLVSDAASYFNEKKAEKLEEQRQYAKQIEQHKQQLAQYQQSVISHIFTQKEIGGETLTEEELDDFYSALYERKIPVQHQGQIYNLTAYEQFDSALQNNFELKMYLFKKYYFRDSDLQKIQTKAEKTAEERMNLKWGKKLKNRTVVDDKKETPIMKVPDGTKSYIYENGQMKAIN